ncbi:mannonate dehydratase [Pedobacter sp. CFBP9032]|uniref:mannonate dehydratase n=1 Tax=Pedobacter sp. CFBP9032 TaxID=3096539 RepID=UPI002A6A96B5|nr:mannonate dehydratase [Pedobacter sp. CFBP9032]MDY0904077.1 mannonate dehydratase [Pedobacter sp. CFBP9032]
MKYKKLEQTWRWYGPNDPVSLQDVKQAGATGIVTALHHIPHGEIWPLEDIQERKAIIEAAGLTWSVVESVPVHEAIKTRRADAGQYLENYNQSLRNLSQCGIKTVCYNFMPVLDWTRTQLDLEMTDGSKALYFNWIDLAIFDLYILKRVDADQDYSASILKRAEEKHANLSEQELTDLRINVLMGIPNEKEIELETLRTSINEYAAIGTLGLKENLKHFLNSIADVCTEEGIKMTIHPDDPPYPILGLPRIASTLEDFKYIIKEVDLAFNGVCFCTGSLGAGMKNDALEIFDAVKERVYFAHLRNVTKDEDGSFYEADHLGGDVNMYEIMKAISAENALRYKPIPFRPDHGHQMLDDLAKQSNPGYSAIGRLRGLAELRGLEVGVTGNY